MNVVHTNTANLLVIFDSQNWYTNSKILWVGKYLKGLIRD